MGEQEEYRLGRVNGRFYAVWYEGGRRRRRSLGTDDKATANASLGEFKRQISFQRTAGKALTVGAIYTAYAADRESEGKAAGPRIRDAWKRLKGTFDSLSPVHITKALCRAYMTERRRTKVSDGTIHVELGYLRSALKFAWREGWITAIPYVPLPRKPAPREHHLTRKEADRLIKAAGEPHVRLFIVLALTTAGRASAVLDLTWDRVDMERRIIRLHDPQRDTTVKGRAAVPINDSALEVLQEAQRAALTPFVIEWGGRRVKSVKKGVGAAAARAGLKASPHVLRHTAAVWMAEAGIRMPEIAQYLGHRDDLTTQRIYARFSPGHLRKAAEALELGFAQRSLPKVRPKKAKQVSRKKAR